MIIFYNPIRPLSKANLSQSLSGTIGSCSLCEWPSFASTFVCFSHQNYSLVRKVPVSGTAVFASLASAA